MYSPTPVCLCVCSNAFDHACLSVCSNAFDYICVSILVINTKTLQFNKYCKGLPVKASKQQKSFWGWHSICERLQLPLQDELSWSSVGYSLL